MLVTKDEVSDLIKANNDKLMSSFKDLLSDTIQQINGANNTKVEEHLTKSKELKYEPQKFKKRANKDQYKFNLKMAETINSARSAAQKSQLEKVKSDFKEGEKLLNERQKHILLAVKLEFGWCSVDEYKQHDLADDSDDEKRVYSAEWRACVAISTRKKKALASTTGKKPLPNQGPVAWSSSQPQLQSFQASFNFPAFTSCWPNMGTCFACGKPGHWRACCPAKAKQSSSAPKWRKEQDLHRKKNSKKH